MDEDIVEPEAGDSSAIFQDRDRTMAFVMTPTSSKCFLGSKQAAPAPRRAAPVVSIQSGLAVICGKLRDLEGSKVLRCMGKDPKAFSVLINLSRAIFLEPSWTLGSSSTCGGCTHITKRRCVSSVLSSDREDRA